MDSKELKYEKSLSYDQLTQFLLKKYGAAEYDYFCKSNCKTKDKRVSRTKEGLICHHICEKYALYLSDSASASREPFEYQKAENLCYCNYLEHFLLHIKIAYGYEAYVKDNKILHKERTEPRSIHWDTSSAYNLKRMIPINVGMGYIGYDMNELYASDGSKTGWKQRCYLEIKDNLEDYTDILAEHLQTAVDSFTGNKQYKSKFKVGYIFRDKSELLEIRKDKFCPTAEELEEFYIRRPDGNCEWISRCAFDPGDYSKCVEEMITSFSCDWKRNVSQPVKDSLTKKVKL